MAKILFFLMLLLAMFSNVFSQQNDLDKNRITPFVPVKLKINPLTERINIVKRELDSYNFERYSALVDEDPAICNNEDCKNSYNELLVIKYLAEGRCEKIENKTFREFCAALNNNTCDTLRNNNEKLWCKAMLEGDPSSVFNVSPLEGSTTKSDILEEFGIFWGIKNNNYISCAKHIQAKDVSFSKRYACRIIFSSNPSEEVEKIKRDLTLFTLSRRDNNLEYCNLISDTKIKKSCLDSKVKELKDL